MALVLNFDSDNRLLSQRISHSHKKMNEITCCVKTVNDVFMKYDLAHLRHRADSMNLTNE